MPQQPSELDQLRIAIECANTMLRDTESTDREKEEHVQKAMAGLEECVAVNSAAACCLMASLWPVASELYMHDVL